MTSIFELANARHDKPGALEAQLRANPAYDTQRAFAFEAGAIPAKPASRGPRSAFDGLLADNGSRFEEAYGGDTAPQIRRRKRKMASRTFGSWSDIPPQLRFHYTEKERAALHIIVEMIRRSGFCQISLQEIADRAGVHRNTVKNAISEAKKLGHLRIQLRPRPGQKHLPSIITIKSEEWLDWLAKGTGDKRLSALRKVHKQTGNTGAVEPTEGALEKVKAAAVVPNHVQWRHNAGDDGLIARLSDDRRTFGRGSIALTGNRTRK